MHLRSRPAALLASALLALSLSACSDASDAAKDAVSEIASSAQSELDGVLEKLTDGTLGAVVGQATNRVLAKAGIELEGTPTCTADLDPNVGTRSAEGTVRCQGTSSKGKKVVANFSGTITLDGDSACKGRLVVKVSNVKKVDKKVDVCKLAAAAGAATSTAAAPSATSSESSSAS